MQIDVAAPPDGADIEQFEPTIKAVFKGEKTPAVSLIVIFMSRDDLRRLKQQYFGLDVYTDVIAFHLNEPDEAVEGEIYLSYEQIKYNAVEYVSSNRTELYRVLIHGCLHLCGYEDDTPEHKQEMTKLENHYLNQLVLR